MHEQGYHQIFTMGQVDQVVLVVIVDCVNLRICFCLSLFYRYFLEVSLSLFDGTDQHRGGLDVLLAVFLWYGLTYEDAIAVG